MKHSARTFNTNLTFAGKTQALLTHAGGNRSGLDKCQKRIALRWPSHRETFPRAESRALHIIYIMLYITGERGWT